MTILGGIGVLFWVLWTIGSAIALHDQNKEIQLLKDRIDNLNSKVRDYERELSCYKAENLVLKARTAIK